MFWIMVFIGVVGFILCCLWFMNVKEHRVYAVIVALLCAVLFFGAFFTAQGTIYRKQLLASAKKGNWLVIDNSGGETLRHWVLKKSYVKGSDQSDGWQFYDKIGNLCYVSGDCFVMRINHPLEEFQVSYKKEYNIPEIQEALH